MSQPVVQAAGYTPNEDASPLVMPKDLPGTYGSPFVGELLKFIASGANEFIFQRHEKYGGSVFKTKILGGKTVVISDNEVVDYLLRREGKLVESNMTSSVRDCMGEHAIAMVHGESHGRQRRIMNRGFSPTMMEKMLPSLVEISHRFLDSFSMPNNTNKDGSFPDVHEAAWSFAFEIVITNLLGKEHLNAETTKQCAQWMLALTDALISVPINLPFTVYGKGMKARKRLAEFLGNRMKQIRLEQEANEGIGSVEDTDKVPTLFEHLATAQDEDTQEYLSDLEVIDTGINVVWAGTDTSATTLSMILVFLGNRPDIVKKLQDEQDEIIQRHGEEITTDAIRDMNYLDATWWEFLRLNPPVGALMRRSLEDMVIPGVGLSLPKGTQLLLTTFPAHARGEDLGRDTNGVIADLKSKIMKHFDPDYVVEHGLHKQSEQSKNWYPFGAGKRKCLGKPLAELEARVFTSLLVRKYDIELTGDKFPKLNMIPMYHPMGKVPIKFIPRS